jgi:hypothetical protein
MDNDDDLRSLRIPFCEPIPLRLYNWVVDFAKLHSMTVEEVVDLAMENYFEAHLTPEDTEGKLPAHKQTIVDAEIAEARKNRDAGIQPTPIKHMKLFE